MDSNHQSRSGKGLAFFETTLIDLGPFTFAGSSLPRQRHLYDVRAGHLRALRHGPPDEDLEETLALIRAKLVELEKAFKQGRPASKLPD